MTPEPAASRGALETALRDYVQARSAALLSARKILRIGELDARALLFIVDNPGTRPGVLRGYLGITAAGVTTLTDRLVDRAVVRRDLDPSDRRMVRLTATIDIGAEPWSALTRFDTDFASAIAAHDLAETESAAALLSGFTRSVTDRS
ncbi:MAG: MarR family transcriptional regulator [Micrococcales bacterium]|nr:MarR family transcriptional regulator [Micrococcales bacterium]